MQFFFPPKNFLSSLLALLHATESAALPDCWPRLLSADSLNVSHIATITEGRTYSLIWCFSFTALMSLLARLKQCKLSQLGQCQPKCPALQSLLCCPLWFRAPSFPLPLVSTPLTCYSSAVMMWQSAAQRLLKSGRGQCEKLLWILFVTAAQLFFLPSLGSVPTAPTVYHWMQP